MPFLLRYAQDDRLKPFTVAVLELRARAARTWVVTAYLLLHMYRSIALRLATIGHEVCTRCAHLAHIRLALLGRSLCLRSIPEYFDIKPLNR